MNKNLKKCTMLAIWILLLSGCAGYDRILFITKTNVGIDIDNTPPTAEITIARRELAITPTYQDTISGENTLPLLGSFGTSGTMFNPTITSVFAGGDAAVKLASGVASSTVDPIVVDPICLNEEPDARSPIKKFWHWITNTDKEAVTRSRAFYFATDTAFGVKVAWNGTGGPYPTSFKLGYNRAEFAYPPIFITKNNECGDNVDSGDMWEVNAPSFFASLKNKTRMFGAFGDPELGVKHVQFFATGAAAEAWAGRSSVNKATFKTMAPEAATIEEGD